MGFLALGNMLLAVIVASFAFQIAKAAWQMPSILNVPGAFLVFNSVITLSGWATHDLFDGYMHMSAPDVPWYGWLLYLGMALFWYFSMAFALMKWRENTTVTPDTNL
jgi:hypothetical protein